MLKINNPYVRVVYFQHKHNEVFGVFLQALADKRFKSTINSNQFVMHELILFVWTVFMGMFAIMNPIVSTPIFIGLTQSNTHAEKRRIAFYSVLYAFIIVVAFCVSGQIIFTLVWNYIAGIPNNRRHPLVFWRIQHDSG